MFQLLNWARGSWQSGELLKPLKLLGGTCRKVPFQVLSLWVLFHMLLAHLRCMFPLQPLPPVHQVQGEEAKAWRRQGMR
jgi:hypothetical protein